MGRPAVWNARGYSWVAATDGSQMCANDPEMWFSESTGETRQAKRACAECPFMRECRLEGLVNGNRGVWGGLSHVDRQRMGAKDRQGEINRLRAEISARAKKG